MLAFEQIELEIDSGIAVLRLNRPHALNAMSPRLLLEAASAFDQLTVDDSTRVVVLTGNGAAFSAGADLAATFADPPIDEDGQWDLGYLLKYYYNPLLLKMRRLPQPVIAAVNGIAAGGASSLALLADLTLAARSAVFFQAFVHVGLSADVGGSWILQRRLGSQRAAGALLLGEKILAEEALKLGLIWSVHDDAQLMPDAMRLAQRLAQAPQTAVRAIKHALNAASEHTLEQQLALECELQRACGQAQDFQMALQRFAGKRGA